jgi:hypothetical protein
LRPILILAGAYISWLGMMALHEAGHVAHARLSGGTVERVSIPLIGFSQTFYATNPNPRFVTWGGPIWGSILPLIFLAAAMAFQKLRRAVQFFAGFCSIANGAYIGLGWTMRAGDAAELVKHGEAVWRLIAFGLVAGAVGLYLWHRLGVKRAVPSEIRPSPQPSPPSTGERA